MKNEEKELYNKKILDLSIVIGLMSIIPFFILILVVAFFKLETIIQIILISLAITLLIVGVTIVMEIERKVGYYHCNKCDFKYIPNALQFWISPHIFRTRYLKCPKCHKYSWNKKKLTK